MRRLNYLLTHQNLVFVCPIIEPVKGDPPFKALNDWNDHLNRVAELDSIFPKKYLPLHRAMSPAREIYVPRSRPKSIFDDPLRAYGYNYAGKVW